MSIEENTFKQALDELGISTPPFTEFRSSLSSPDPNQWSIDDEFADVSLGQELNADPKQCLADCAKLASNTLSLVDDDNFIYSEILAASVILEIVNKNINSASLDSLAFFTSLFGLEAQLTLAKQAILDDYLNIAGVSQYLSNRLTISRHLLARSLNEDSGPIPESTTDFKACNIEKSRIDFGHGIMDGGRWPDGVYSAHLDGLEISVTSHQKLTEMHDLISYLSIIRHPNIVKVFGRVMDKGVDIGAVCQEGLVGATRLDDVMDTKRYIPLVQALKITIQLLRVVICLFEDRTLPNDITPSCIILSSDKIRVDVISLSLHDQGDIMIDNPYTPPECVDGKPRGHFAAVYSIGVLLGEMLGAGSTIDTNQYPHDLAGVVRRCTLMTATKRLTAPAALSALLRLYNSLNGVYDVLSIFQSSQADKATQTASTIMGKGVRFDGQVRYGPFGISMGESRRRTLTTHKSMPDLPVIRDTDTFTVKGLIVEEHGIDVVDIGECSEGNVCSKWGDEGIPVSGVRCISSCVDKGILTVFCGIDSTIQVWRMEPSGAQCRGTLRGHDGDVWIVKPFHDQSNGLYMISGSQDGTLHVWSIEEMASVGVLAGHEADVLCVCVYADGMKAVSGGQDSALIQWNIKSCAGLNRVHTPTPLTCMDITEELALTGHWNGHIISWDLETMSMISTLVGHEMPVSTIRVFSNGERAISGCRDHTLRLWNLLNGTTTSVLKGHTDYINDVHVFDAGKQAISLARGDKGRVWALQGDEGGVASRIFGKRGPHLRRRLECSGIVMSIAHVKK